MIGWVLCIEKSDGNVVVLLVLYIDIILLIGDNERVLSGVWGMVNKAV